MSKVFMLFYCVLLISPSVRAQDVLLAPPSKNIIGFGVVASADRIGMTGDVFSVPSSEFFPFPDKPPVCLYAGNASGFGSRFGLSAQISLNSYVVANSFECDITYNTLPLTFDIVRACQPIAKAWVDIHKIQMDVLYKYNFIPSPRPFGFGLAIGPWIAFRIGDGELHGEVGDSTYTVTGYTDVLDEPVVTWGAIFKTFYDIPLTTTLVLSPAVGFSYQFNDETPLYHWRLSSIFSEVAFRYFAPAL